MSRAEGTTAVVIGGTHGMGMETAKTLLRNGVKVLVTGSSSANVERARTELGPDAVVVRSDASSMDDIEHLATIVQDRLGMVDAVFVFAAVAAFEAFDQVGEASFDRQFAINTRGAFFTVQRLAPLVNDGGSITFTTVTPATASPAMSVYMGTKAAVGAFARSFAAELLPRHIRVNTLAPGFIDTPTLGLRDLTPEDREEIRTMGDRATPMKRHGTVSEVADAALFLAFHATFSTGIELPIDGGLSTIDNPG